jgi:hypothetical protein
MDRYRGLSTEEKEELLERIDEILGTSPKGRLLREIVETLPPADDEQSGAPHSG